MADEPSIPPFPQPALPLAYEPPQPKASSLAVWGTVLISLFVCGSSIAIFALEEEGRRYSYNGNAGAADTWPAAIAVLALAIMGTSLGFFLTRRR